jgi:hypothetical protein
MVKSLNVVFVATLLAASPALAGRMELLEDQLGVVISSGPSNFISGANTPPYDNITGCVVWFGPTGLLTGVYAFSTLSVTSFPAESAKLELFIGGDLAVYPWEDRLTAIPTWSAVEDYATSPRLIGALAVVSSSGSQAFTTDFPVGSTLAINLAMSSDPRLENCEQYERLHTVPQGDVCLQVTHGEVSTTSVPEPSAMLTFAGALFATWCFKRRSKP